MSIINITDVTVLNNPAKFTDPYLFKITFECMAPLQDDLEWKLTYVGSAESDSFDQELDTCMVGPVPVGVNSFEFEAAAPLPTCIPASDLIGVTVILLTCSYNDAEFVRIGYYVNTEYSDPELKRQHDASLEEGAEEKGLKAPNPLELVEKMQRNVLADKPRVTKFNIQWDTPAAVPTISSTDPISAPASQALAADSGASSAPPPPFNPYAAAA
ncbi:Histone chaperone ASF1 [Rhodotorula toruloides]|uniref:Anti-silencing function protein 1 n=1 Tax=Rhodotorula toruloides TaxID=5286 RepID=A0A0K3CPT7_RHOTO|nr:Histone chaperone ASF1 [Rhodotorula toruloides]PRQ71077.1 Histone chaperone, ASF1-like protein [Rhodotorula toruloides]